MEVLPSVVGIDPSLTGLCICGYDKDQFWTETFTSSPAAKVKDRIDRYTTLAGKVVGLVLAQNPKVIFLEGYSYGSKGRSVLDIAEFGGILREHIVSAIEGEYLEADRPEFLEIPPGCVKKFATGKGNANKIQVAIAIAKRYDVELKGDDEYDAYALAAMAATYAGIEEPQTAFQRAVIDEIRNPVPKKQRPPNRKAS